MCNVCDFDHQISLPEIRKVVREILENGIVRYDTPHFKQRISERGITIVDVNNVLRAGTQSGPEFQGSEWRHTAFTQRFRIVYHIVSSNEIVLITAIKQ